MGPKMRKEVFSQQAIEQLKANGEMEVPLKIDDVWMGLATVVADDIGLKVTDITEFDPTIRRLVLGTYFLRFK